MCVSYIKGVHNPPPAQCAVDEMLAFAEAASSDLQALTARSGRAARIRIAARLHRAESHAAGTLPLRRYPLSLLQSFLLCFVNVKGRK